MKQILVIVSFVVLMNMLWVGTANAVVTVEKLEFLTDTTEYEETPIWTADGNKIMYCFQRTVWNDRDSYIMNSDGTEKERIGIGEGYLISFEDLSPDGTELLTMKSLGYWFDLYKVNINNGIELPIAADSSKVEAAGSWSPDGKYITYNQDSQLWIMDSDGNNKYRLGTSWNLEENDWYPDGSKIIYSAMDSKPKHDLWMINSDGTNQVQITDTPYYERWPSFSPNGKYIVYASDEDDTYDLWLRNLDGSYKTKLVDIVDGDAAPNWSPDGKKIVFVGRNNGNLDIAVLTLSFDDEGPITSNVIASHNPVSIDTDITLTASSTDETTGGSTISSAEYNVDGGSFSGMSTKEGTFDEVTENVTVDIGSFREAGIHEICVRSTDSVGNVGDSECILLAIYDPSLGFVTGGGWIYSPPEAYIPVPSLTGKANFGFVSKYKKGATTPTGQTEFQFNVADLNFHSGEYQWLVIAGSNAKYKGTGTINGAGNYGFILTANDGDLNGGDEIDTFRIKIWDKDNGDSVVYDNELEVSDIEYEGTQLGGGSIMIHQN